jgi:uncharacterized membrane protein YdbT with pleckstrin-like domain
MSSSPYNIKDLPMSAHHVRGSLFIFGLRIALLLIIYFILSIALTVFLAASVTQPMSLQITSGFVLSFSFIEIYLYTQIILFIIEALTIVLLILIWSNGNVYLSSTHLITYRGLFTMDEDIYELAHLKAVKLHQSFMGKLCNYGNLKAMFASSGYHEDVELKNISNPKVYERALKEHAQIKMNIT